MSILSGAMTAWDITARVFVFFAPQSGLLALGSNPIIAATPVIAFGFIFKNIQSWQKRLGFSM